ncbi:cell division protein CrgA [Hoyosella rhizosphaerae]|uniref:Cell division protein CrgA n=1 Tax=Hoyosella rhizosphaerae TaxID=1755582 RepID=A0A916U901_9ACTN|nr:cell division protein CrgA [Hoyosella rhizosphaerae]MBN4927459.1 cell division protein CrgA [Hoyosella rhizosphaerae]GGC64256.1 cell division protein CrgA [Hoyosella rhizosphaerae]
MPKSRVRKKDHGSKKTSGATGATLGSDVPSSASHTPVSRTPVKVKGPSSTLYVSVMLGFMLAGLIWLVVYYLAGPEIPLINELGAWNFLIGFGLWIVGLVMTLKWR